MPILLPSTGPPPLLAKVTCYRLPRPSREKTSEQHLICFQWHSKTQAVVVPRSVTCYPASSRGHDEHRRLRYPNQESRNAGPG